MRSTHCRGARESVAAPRHPLTCPNTGRRDTGAAPRRAGLRCRGAAEPTGRAPQPGRPSAPAHGTPQGRDTTGQSWHSSPAGGTGHDYRACPDEFCDRFPCRIYREGYADGSAADYAAGQADGFAEGYSTGHTDGYVAGADAGR